MKKPLLLFVDDNDGLRKSLATCLEMEFQVIQASNGDDALSLLEQHSPDLLLLDLKMPGMSGLELLKKIRREGRDLEVIIITGESTHSLATECADLGVQGYLQKPILPEVLTERVKKELGIEEFNYLKELLKENYSARLLSLDPRAKKLLLLVEKHCHSDLKMKEAASLLEMSPYHMNKLFKEECGMTLKEYIDGVRIHRSREYLSGYEHSIQHRFSR